MPPGYFWDSYEAAASGSLWSVNTGLWQLAAAVGGSGFGRGVRVGLRDHLCLPSGGDHLSCSTPGLFRQCQAVVTSSGGSLVVFVFFFSDGGSLWLTAHTPASGSSRWSESLAVCPSHCWTEARVHHVSLHLLLLDRNRSFPLFSAGMNLACLWVWCGGIYWFICTNQERKYQPNLI